MRLRVMWEVQVNFFKSQLYNFPVSKLSSELTFEKFRISMPSGARVAMRLRMTWKVQVKFLKDQLCFL